MFKIPLGVWVIIAQSLRGGEAERVVRKWGGGGGGGCRGTHEKPRNKT